MRASRTLVLLRHGQSVWNAEGRFAGWIDVPLSPHGRDQARRCARLLADADLRPDIVHTSVLSRATLTADLVLDALNTRWVPVRRSWRLNERHYGALQGRIKAEIRAEYGNHCFARWRRAYDGRPPELTENSTRSSGPATTGKVIPRAESLRDVFTRLLPYWKHAIVPRLAPGSTTLIVAHSNSLRALVKHVDRLSDDGIMAVNIPTGIPLRYDLDDDLNPIVGRGRYLDAAAAAAAIEIVASEGSSAETLGTHHEIAETATNQE
ncbi:2,3-bisphosphoglycerate-dependent phosphoglycerate mutase [Nocardia mikamii]|uniref:2,3-bisphosphoglycerate-dependent phosphoglycerate mutase n=1 Tax=Nocardia mikamii TaxID=508464 RepID=UPI0007A49340|nr:2,3-bisphosphoglycerate-dependent phosphoglycerate mutase [Nocardia mikamii]